MSAENVLLREIRKGNLIIDEYGRFWKYRKGQIVRAENRVSNDYLQLRKMVNGTRYHVGAHRLVWLYFKGDISEGGIINHRDGQKDNNHPDNLEIITYSGNMKHSYKHGLSNQYGERNHRSKLTDKQIAEIRLAYSNGYFTQMQLAEKYGVSFQCISKVVRGTRRQKQAGEIRDYTELRQRAELERDKKTGRFIGKKRAGRQLDGEEYNEFPVGKAEGDEMK